jgi:hypothetical protein
MPAKLYKQYPAPPKMPLSLSPHAEDNERAICFIVNSAYENACSKINGTLAKLSPEQQEKLHDMAEERGFSSTPDYLRARISEISRFYLGYRTGLTWVRDNFNGEDVTLHNVSAHLTELSDALGIKLTDQIYRTLSSSIDETLEASFGKGRRR